MVYISPINNTNVALVSGILLFVGDLQPPTASLAQVEQNPGVVAAPEEPPNPPVPNPEAQAAAVLEEIDDNPNGDIADDVVEDEFADLPDLEVPDNGANGNGGEEAAVADNGDVEEPPAV